MRLLPATTMLLIITLCTILVVAQIDLSAAFTSLGGLAVHIKSTPHSNSSCFPTFAAASSDNNEAEGGTEWIKDSMGTDSTPPPAPVPVPTPVPTTPAPLEFTTDEIQDMEKLILALSEEQNDELRRQKLADMLDKELNAPAAAEDASSDITDNSDGSGEAILPQEIPRFAQLFQYSLDIIGENVQAAAREKAMEMNENSLHVIEEDSANVPGTGSDRVKSDEELQLWALIDMMVQSKTQVKLFMGSLGSKGAFR